ncbi:hypothetical protein SDC9_122334 [bioreactor metagenome]|uniref:Uncharacterized protein n=1 Tax=bioreactor metagenome TaxID=1076179 RepID=A0A645CEQ6_9ZZZZ
MKKLAKKIAALFFAVSLTVLFAMPAFAATFPNSYYSTSSSNKTALRVKVSNTSEFLNVYSSTIGDQTAISTWSEEQNKTKQTTQKFVVYRAGDGIVTIRMYDNLLLAISSSAGNCILRYIPNAALNNIQISRIHPEKYNGPFYAWTFDVSSGGSLTATNSPTPIRGGYMVAWQNFTGSNRQIWNVEPW